VSQPMLLAEDCDVGGMSAGLFGEETPNREFCDFSAG